MCQENKLPERTLDTMSMAIEMSSPSGKMSKRAKLAADKKLKRALFGESGLIPIMLPQESKQKRNRRQAKELRELFDRGMRAKKYLKEADRLEDEADRLDLEEANESNHAGENRRPN